MRTLDNAVHQISDMRVFRQVAGPDEIHFRVAQGQQSGPGGKRIASRDRPHERGRSRPSQSDSAGIATQWL